MTVEWEKTRKIIRRVDRQEDFGQRQELFPVFPLKSLPIFIYLGAKQLMNLDLHYW